MKKYVLVPGPVVSRTDGDVHHISAGRLADLYGVSMDECVIYDRRQIGRYEGLEFLHPRFDGKYEKKEVRD